jgi:phosphoesterase RecJ-like protein
MAWQALQQATETIKRAKRTLVLAPENPTADALATLAAVLSYLNAHQIPVDGIVPQINPEKIPSYLPARDKVQSKLTALRDLKIKLDVSRSPIHELSYDVKDSKLEILLTPKTGEWHAEDVQIMPGEDRYEAIIAIGFPDRQSLSSAFREPTDIIHRLPIINLDHDAKNEHWAPINLIDLAATSSAEMAMDWFEDWDKAKINEQIATALLAGLISNTNSFRSAKVTPKTLEKAARLISLGADRENVVHGLWRTRQINTLKLWGRALARLEHDRSRGLVWTTLSRQDILDSGTTEARLDELVNELIAFVPDAKLTAVFVEHDAFTTRMALFAQPPYSANVIGRPLGLDGSHQRASGAIAKPLMEARDYAIETLRQQLK